MTTTDFFAFSAISATLRPSFLAGVSFLGGSSVFGAPATVSGRGGKLNDDLGPLADFALHVHRTVVAVDDLARDGQAEAAAAGAGGEEGLEDLGDVLGRDAFAAVDDAEQDGAAGGAV